MAYDNGNMMKNAKTRICSEGDGGAQGWVKAEDGVGGGSRRTERQKGGGHCLLFLGRELLIEPPFSSNLVLQLYAFLQS